MIPQGRAPLLCANIVCYVKDKTRKSSSCQGRKGPGLQMLGNWGGMQRDQSLGENGVIS